MSFKFSLLLLSILLFSCVVQGPKSGSVVSDSLDEAQLAVDAGPDLYTTGSTTTNAKISSAPDRTYKWTAPAAVTIASSETPNTLVSSGTEGYAELTLTVTSGSQIVSDTTRLIIDTTNPVVSVTSPILDAGDPFIPDASVVEINPLTYAWVKISGPGSVNFSNSRVLKPTVTVGTTGTYVLRLTATDAAGNSHTGDLSVTADFIPPVVTALANELKDAIFSKTITATDDNTMTYLWEKISGPGAITFSASTNATTNISASADGNYIIRATVTDSFLNSSIKTFSLKWDTTAPVITIADFNVNGTFTANPTITELTPTTYLWAKVTGPGTVNFSNAASANPSISISTDGTYDVRLTLTDAFGQSTASTFQVIWDVTAPVVTVGGGGDIYTNGLVAPMKTVVETNPVINYKWTYSTFAPLTLLAFIPSDDILNPSVTATSEGQYRIKLTVTDGAGNIGSDQQYLLWDTSSPTVSAPNDLKLKTATSISATSPDSNLTVAWTSAPAGVSFTPNNNLTTSVVAADGNYILTVSVTDQAGNSSSDTTNLLWDATPPVVTMPAGVVTNSALNLDASSTDLTNMTYQWAKVSGPGTMVFNSELAEDTIASASAEGDYVISLTATDELSNVTSMNMNFIWDVTLPTVNSGIDTTENGPYTQDSTASDDRGTITYAWSKVTGSGNLTFTNTTDADPQISADADGDYIVKLEVTDDAGNTNSDTFNLKWDTTAPVVDAGIDQKTNILSNQDATVTEANIQTYLWEKTAGPGSITFGSAAAVDTSVSANLDGTYTIRLTATDTAGNSADDSATFLWDTTDPLVNAGTDTSENASYTQDATVTDALSGIESYLWSKTSGPGTITFSNNAIEDPDITASSDGTYVITLTSTDQAGNSTSDTFQLEWDTSNPVVDAGADKIETGIFTQNATVTDATTVTYLWSKVTGPGNLSFGTGTSEDSTITADADGSYVIRLTATDVLGNSASDDFTLIWDTNNPAVDVSPDELKNAVFLKDATVTDANSAEGLTYLWEKISGPGTINFSSINVEDPNITTTADGAYVVRLTVTDIAGNNGNDTFALTWDTIPPAVNAGADEVENALFSHTGTATDLNNVTVVWTKFSGPGTITFSAPTNLTTNISADTDGDYVIKLTATDDVGNLTSDTFNLTYDGNPPAVDAGTDKTTNILISQDATVSDASGIASYLWTKSAGGGTITFSANTSEDTNLSASADGSYTISLAATDNAGNTGNDTFTFIWDTTPPTVGAGADTKENVGFIRTATATDALTSMTHLWSKSAGPGTLTFSSATILGPTISASTDGTYTVNFQSTDAAGNVSSDNFELEWDTSNPVVDAGTDKTATALFAQDATVNDATTITYGWSKQSGPGGLVFSAQTSEDTNVTADTDGVYVVKLTATDEVANIGSDTFNLIWDENPPTINMNGATELKNTPFVKDITTTDANSALGLTYSWSKTAGAGTVNFSSTTAEDPTISTSADGIYTIEVQATDSAGNSSTGSFTLTWDTTAPTVGAGIDEDKNISFAHAGTASDTSGVASTTWSSSPSANVSFSDSSTLNPTVTVTSDGTYTITLSATDNAGNTGTDSYVLLYDSSAPTVSAGTDVITRVGTLQNATITEANISTIVWSGAGLNFSNTGAEDTTISSAIDGLYTATLTVTDKAGNSTNDTMSFTWDTTPPSVNAGIDVADKVGFVQDSTISDTTTTATILWSMTSGPGAVNFSDNGIEDPTVTATVDGNYIVTATATDQAGNINSDSFALTWDTTAPVIGLTSPQTSGASFSPGPTISDISSFTCLWAHSAGSGTPTFTPNATTCNPTISVIDSGAHTFTVTATDALGNSSNNAVIYNNSSKAALKGTQGHIFPQKNILYYFEIEGRDDLQAHCELMGRQIINKAEWNNTTMSYLCSNKGQVLVNLNPKFGKNGNLKAVTPKALRHCTPSELSVCIGKE